MEIPRGYLFYEFLIFTPLFFISLDSWFDSLTDKDFNEDDKTIDYRNQLVAQIDLMKSNKTKLQNLQNL